MKQLPIKIGVAGTHSSGKSTFMRELALQLEVHNLRIYHINNLATRARELGFPILTEHTFESTLWIMAECMRQEAEASLTCDVILVDRPVLDALGYLRAALEITGRNLRPGRFEELYAIACAHTADYDLLVITCLDHGVPLGEGRDYNLRFRRAAADHISTLASEIAPGSPRLYSTNLSEIVSTAGELVLSRLDVEG